MAKAAPKRIAFVSSFPPVKCGIATFTSDLIRNTTFAAKGGFEPIVAAMRFDSQTRFEYPVRFEIRQNVKSDYLSAADYINFSQVEAVSVQHEFGLFGGGAGAYLSLLLEGLNAPIITTLHTVLNEPNEAYYKSMMDVCNMSARLITMNLPGVEILQRVYGVSEKKIALIPHGIPDLAFVDNNYYKHKFGMQGRRTILTFGLLSRNKGIEVMLDAMPAIVKAEPSALYIVLGMTHPSVIKHEGESYRFYLGQKVKELGVSENVIFHNRFVSDEELHNFLCAADVYVTPYLNKEQLTSGTLSFAVGTGKAVVSTPYWAATELLADGRGMLVPFKDSEKLAQAMIQILKNDNIFYSLRRKAYEYGRSRTWPKIGQVYWKFFNSRSLPSLRPPTSVKPAVKKTPAFEMPEPSLEHIKRLTDDTGILQHSRGTIANRRHGYCADDNARAMIVMTKYYSQYPEPEVLSMLDKYLSFTMHAQKNDGTMRNFMNFDRTWVKNEPSSDAQGRTLWALGSLLANPPWTSYLPLIKELFEKSLKHASSQYPRITAYSILGMSEYLKRFPQAQDVKKQMALAADRLVEAFDGSACEQWLWFEDRLTYDNAVLPHALFIAGSILGEKYTRIAEITGEFLLKNTFTGSHFSFVGSHGWYKKGQEKAVFDQQPVEAAGTILMLKDIYEITKNSRYLLLQRKAFDWFFGENDLHIPVYDFKTKGCHDGLTASGVNANQGAESILSFLLSLLTVNENYSSIEKTTSDAQPGGKTIPAQGVKPPVAVKTVSGNVTTKKEAADKRVGSAFKS